MNTKNKIVAILMAGMVAMAVGVPMAMSAETPATSATVNNKAPTVVSVSSDPETYVVMNVCPNTTPVNITAEVKDLNGVDNIDTVEVNILGIQDTYVAMTCSNTDDTTKSCYKVFNLDCCQAPGTYTATVKVTDKGSQSDTGTDDFTVNGTKALSINFDKVTFVGDPGSSDNAGNANITSGTSANVTSKGNAVIDIGVEASDLSSTTTGDSIAGTNMKATIGAVGPAVVSPKNVFNTDTTCKEDESAAFTLSIPEAILPANDYQGTLTISAE